MTELPPYNKAVVTLPFFLEYVGVNVAKSAILAGLAKLAVADETWSNMVQWYDTTIGYDHVWLFIGLSVIVHAVLYYGMNFTYLSFHYNKWFQKYQIPRTKGQPFPTPERLRATIIEGSLSHFTSLPIGGLALFNVMRFFGGTMEGPLPSFYTMFWQLLVAVLFLDFSFYWAHRAFHTPTLYKLFHKKHHEYKWTIGFAAEWAHPVEHLFANQLTMTVAVALMGVHGYTWLVWLAFRLMDTFQHHSGYAFPIIGTGATKFHDFHHTTNVGAYASEFMDALFGTNEQWVMKKRKELAEEKKAAKAA